MGDKVFRIINEFGDDSTWDLYGTKEKAEKALEDTYRYYPGMRHDIVPFELPEGIHLPGFGKFPHEERDANCEKDGRPYLRVYYPNCVEGYPEEHYLFDNMDIFKRWVCARWPEDIKWKVQPYPGSKSCTLDGFRDDQYGWWCAAFVYNITPCEFAGKE